MEPTILYKKGGMHRGPKGLPFSYRGVTTEEQLDSLLKDGWFLDLESAMSGVKPKEPVIETGVIKGYDELTDDEKKEIGMDILDAKLTDKEIRDKFNVHHLTFKKLKADVLD